MIAMYGTVVDTVCLMILLFTSYRVPEARFIALQAQEELLRTRYSTLSLADRSALRQSLWAWLKNDVDASDPAYIRNKFSQVLVLLFKHQYSDGTSWSTFFDDLIALVTNSANTSRAEVMLYMFLRISMAIDEEIISKDSTRTNADIEAANIIKDHMREGAVIKLRDVWFEILFSSCRSGNMEAAGACLRIIGAYVLWIEIKLIVVPEFISTLYECLNTTGLRVAAVHCFMGIIDKGMGDAQKLDLIQAIRASDLPSMVMGTLDKGLNLDEDEEFVEQVAKYINALGVELCLCWEHTQTFEVRGPCLVHLRKILPYAVKYLEHEYDDLSSIVFPFVDEYIKLLKDIQRNPVGLKGFAQQTTLLSLSESDIIKLIEDSVQVLLKATIGKMKYDEEEPHEFGEAAGEEEALFQQLRRVSLL
jgi:exportin-T